MRSWLLPPSLLLIVMVALVLVLPGCGNLEEIDDDTTTDDDTSDDDATGACVDEDAPDDGLATTMEAYERRYGPPYPSPTPGEQVGSGDRGIPRNPVHLVASHDLLPGREFN